MRSPWPSSAWRWLSLISRRLTSSCWLRSAISVAVVWLQVVADLFRFHDDAGDLLQPLRIEGIVGVEIGQRRLPEAPQRHVGELQPVGLQVDRLLHRIEEFLPFAVDLLDGHRRRGDAQARIEGRLEELADALLVDLAERLLRLDDRRIVALVDADVEHRLDLGLHMVLQGQGHFLALALDLHREGIEVHHFRPGAAEAQIHLRLALDDELLLVPHRGELVAGDDVGLLRVRLEHPRPLPPEQKDDDDETRAGKGKAHRAVEQTAHRFHDVSSPRPIGTSYQLRQRSLRLRIRRFTRACGRARLHWLSTARTPRRECRAEALNFGRPARISPSTHLEFPIESGSPRGPALFCCPTRGERGRGVEWTIAV